MRDREPDDRNTFLVSLPAYFRFIDPYASIDLIEYNAVAVKFKDPSDKKAVEAFKTDVSNTMQTQDPWRFNNVEI